MQRIAVHLKIIYRHKRNVSNKYIIDAFLHWDLKTTFWKKNRICVSMGSKETHTECKSFNSNIIPNACYKSSNSEYIHLKAWK